MLRALTAFAGCLGPAKPKQRRVFHRRVIKVKVGQTRHGFHYPHLNMVRTIVSMPCVHKSFARTIVNLA